MDTLLASDRAIVKLSRSFSFGVSVCAYETERKMQKIVNTAEQKNKSSVSLKSQRKKKPTRTDMIVAVHIP